MFKTAEPAIPLPPAEVPAVKTAYHALTTARERLAAALARHQQLRDLQQGDDNILNAEASLALPAVLQEIYAARLELAKAERAHAVAL